MKWSRALFFCAIALPCVADEGLWLFNQFPGNVVQDKYKFEVTNAFLEKLRLASVQLPGGGGAFVSPHGLLVTNQHLLGACAPTEAFYAAAETGEQACRGLEARVLVALEDVTAQVKPPAAEPAKNAKISAAQTAEALQKRNAAIERVEKACAQKTGNICTVVRLSSGERYDLYQYKKYTDLRLVFAPEKAVAFFGGNPEKLTYPRYDLDIAFLRAYENGKPAETPNYLKWSADGVKENDLVFAEGSPAATERLAIPAQLTFYRDVQLPLTISHIQARIEDLRKFAMKSAENAKLAQATFIDLGIQYKLTAGKLIGLHDDTLFARKQNFEKKLKQAVQHDPKLGVDGTKVWDDLATAYKNWTPFERPYEVLETQAGMGSVLFHIARQIVRGGNTDVAAPIDDAVETVLLARYLEELKALGDKEAPLKQILGGKTPQQAAEDLVHGTKLKDPAARKSAADDPMVRLAHTLEDPARKLQKKHQELIEALEVSAAERIAQYRFRLFGAADYPDGTGTPRVTFGEVKGYKDRAQAPLPYATTFGGLYHLAIWDIDPYKVPQRWRDAKGQMNLITPMNFASTCDITAGASGPVVDKKGELVGLTFDRNNESIAITYLYSDESARAVHVAVQGVAESLQKLYKTGPLLKELGLPEAAKGQTE